MNRDRDKHSGEHQADAQRGHDAVQKQASDLQLPEFLFHITHVENLTDIAAYGLKSHNRAHAEHSPVDISNQDVNARRSRCESVYGKRLHDYVPLYFRARGPMLSARRDHQARLVVLYVDRSVMRREGVVFTDGNAAADSTTFYDRSEDLKELDWACLNAQYWNEFPDGTRTRCAEVLVPNEIPFGDVDRIVAQNNATAEIAANITSLRTLVKPEWFF